VVERVAARLVSVAERMIRNGGAAGAGNA
jgi:hypothetical protein